MSTVPPRSPDRADTANGAAILDFPRPASRMLRVALIGTFPPRKCGIATFTSDVAENLRMYHPEIDVHVFALDDRSQPHEYGDSARMIASDDPESYRQAARAINSGGYDAVWLQHEYGIFGGEDGAMVLDLVEQLAPPLILTPHTVLSEPSDSQERILTRLVERASRIMTMSRHSRDLLAENYGAPHELLTLVEHGAPDRPFGRQEEFKRLLDLEDRTVLMTFGLLGPGKGLETAIAALPSILAENPGVVYRIVGATHPNLVAEQGETYRENLKAQAEELGVAHAVEWDNRFLDTTDLLDQLEACDIYLTPYPNMQQSTSGTLSYAVALGKAVISTPYLHARELLDGGVGELVAPESPEAIAKTVNALLARPKRLEGLQRKAYAKGRETIWPRFADKCAALVSDAAATEREPAIDPEIQPGLSGFFAMCDATGVMQHAVGIVPDRSHGYCLDDNVRALMFINRADAVTPEEKVRWQAVFAAFVQDAWNAERGGFRNFMRFDRSWCEDLGSEDSNGRTVWALGHTVEHSAVLRDWAKPLYDRALAAAHQFGSPRALAFAMLGACCVLRHEPGHGASRDFVATQAAMLNRLLDEVRRPDWAWFETVLGYDNPRLSQALIEAGEVLEDTVLIDHGIGTLEFVCSRQYRADGVFRPIGSDSFGREFDSMPFDQQPLEAQAAIDAARAAARVRPDGPWQARARSAWDWFFGANDRGVVLADIATGRCRDGINPRGANANCGAESILALHLSRESMLAMRADALRDSDGGTRGKPDGSGKGRNPGRRAVADT